MRVLSLIFFCMLLILQGYGQTCTITTTPTNITCNGASSGSATVSVTGGGGSSSNCLSPQTPGVSHNCTGGCTTTVTTNANVTVGTGQKACITANSYTGQIQLNSGGTAVICGTGATPSIIFNGGVLVVTGSTTLSGISNWTTGTSSITNFGTLTINAATTLEVGLNNHGTINVAGGLTMGYNSSGFVNTGTLTVASGNLTFDNNGTAVNHNTINVTSGTILVDYSKTFTNNCTLTAGSILTNHGTFLNTGNITASGLTSDGGSFTNNRKITISGTTNFTGGSISILANSEITTANFHLSVTVNGTGASCASIKTSGTSVFDWGASFTGQARYCDLNGTIETNSPNITSNISLTTCSCNVNTPTCTSYSWKNAALVQIATTQTVNGLAAGTYSVTATCTGCSNSPLTSSVIITQPSAITFTYAQTNSSCNGNSNGSITVTASGGTGTLQYSKDNGTNYQTGNSFTGLSAGSYSVIVKDANNCTSSAQSVTITQPSAVSFTYTKTNISCNGNTNGSITVTASGGTGTLLYSKDNGANYQSGNSFAGLSAGTYAVIVKDAGNCTSSAQNVVITEPSVISLSISSTAPSCGGSANGNINLTVSGGTAPYTYNWSNGQTTEDLTNIAGGNYSVLVTDSKGCTSTASVTVTEPTPVDITVTKTDITSYGANDGTGTVAINNAGSGGTLAANNCTNTAPQDCTTGCTSTYSSNTGTITIGSPSDKVCLTASNFTGTITMYDAGTLVICGSASPSAFNFNNGAKVIVTGTGSLTLPSLGVNNPCRFENYGTVLVNGNMTNNSIVINGSSLTITGDFSDNGGASLTNLCTMSVGANLQNNGTIHNKGLITAVNVSTVNGGATIIMDNGSELITAGLSLNGTIQGPVSGTCSSVKVSGTTTINGGASLTGLLSLCDANGVETDNSTGLTGFQNCNCTLSDPNCTILWSTGSTDLTVTGLTPGVHSVTVTCGGCSVTEDITIKQTATLLINTVNVNPGDFTIATTGITTVNAQSGLLTSEVIISPELPATGTEEVVTLQIAQGADNKPLEVRLTFNEVNTFTSVKAKFGSDYKNINSDYYEIKNNSKIYFYNEKPSKPVLDITTNLKNGVLLDPLTKQFQITIPVNTIFTASTLAISKINIPPAVSVYGPASVLSWDGTTASAGVYEFTLDLTSSAGSRTYKGQFIIE